MTIESDIEEIRQQTGDPKLKDAFIALIRKGTIVNSGKKRDGKTIWLHKDFAGGSTHADDR